VASNLTAVMLLSGYSLAAEFLDLAHGGLTGGFDVLDAVYPPGAACRSGIIIHNQGEVKKKRNRSWVY
jgi:hypothetical protein